MFCSKDQDVIRFKYKYVYYYFVASWIRDHLSEPEFQALIRTMANSLETEHYANILLFLTHLTKDSVIIDALLASAAASLPNGPLSMLAQDINSLLTSSSSSGTSAIEFRDRPVSESRRTMAEVLDHGIGDMLSEREDASTIVINNLQDADEDSNDEDKKTVMSEFHKINSALKVQSTLCQILRNFPGSIEGSRKLSIAEACCLLSRRILGHGIAQCTEREAEIMEKLIAKIKENDESIGPTAAASQAREGFTQSVLLMAGMLVETAASAISSPEMEETYRLLLDRDDSQFTRLVLAEAHLARGGNFPKRQVTETYSALRGNFAAQQLLRALTVAYFSKYPVPISTKKKMCTELRIKYTPAMDVRSHQHLIG